MVVTYTEVLNNCQTSMTCLGQEARRIRKGRGDNQVENIFNMIMILILCHKKYIIVYMPLKVREFCYMPLKSNYFPYMTSNEKFHPLYTTIEIKLLWPYQFFNEIDKIILVCSFHCFRSAIINSQLSMTVLLTADLSYFLIYSGTSPHYCSH